MNKAVAGFAGVLLLYGCRQTTPNDVQSNQRNMPEAPAPSAPTAPPSSSLPPSTAPAPAPAPAPAQPPEPGTPGGLPADKTPLPEPKGPINPKSAEAAGQVVQHYGALIEQKRFAKAAKLWGDQAAANKVTGQLKLYSEAHLQVGKPFDMEGAAGSSYITVPIVLYGTKSGQSVHRSGNAILRRVNDVPGSTEAQRRWHIERIDWK